MSKPVIEPYKRHLLLCCGKHCDEARKLMKYLKERLAEEGLTDVRANRAGCLGVCTKGPIMVVHPDGVWYCKLSKKSVDRIIEEHLKNGRVVEELAFHIQEGKQE